MVLLKRSRIEPRWGEVKHYRSKTRLSQQTIRAMTQGKKIAGLMIRIGYKFIIILSLSVRARRQKSVPYSFATPTSRTRSLRLWCSCRSRPSLPSPPNRRSSQRRHLRNATTSTPSRDDYYFKLFLPQLTTLQICGIVLTNRFGLTVNLH